jgi:dTDP-4-dehydrorhamnose reductase
MPTAVIIRVALVLGFARTPDTSAVLDNLARKWKAREPVFFPARERRNPIDVASLGNILIDLISDRQLSGVYHVGALDSMTRYELGLHLARQMDVSLDLVREQQASVPGRAPRGEDHFLLTDKLRGVYKFDLGFSNQVIERCFP